MNIRNAELDDLDAVQTLLAQLGHSLGIDSDLFKAAFEQALQDSNHVLLVVEIEDRVIGYVSGYMRMTLYAQRRVGFVDEIVVEENQRSAGAGTMLMAAFEETLEEHGAVLSTLATAGAIPFYQGIGYTGKATYLKKPLG